MAPASSDRAGLPFFDEALIVRLPVRKAGPEGEHRADYHAEVGFVLEADGEAVVVGVGDQLDQFDRPAFYLGKLQNPRVGGLSALNAGRGFCGGLLLVGFFMG